MEEAMLHFSRSVSNIGAPLALVAMLGCITPAGAGMAVNGLSTNGLSTNGLSTNGLGDLNGVAVEAVVIPETAIR
jgi:GLTT repeat (6 copies)